MITTMLKIIVLQANKGDCIIIEYGEASEQHYIVVDSGMGKLCYRQLKKFINEVSSNKKIIDLMILTHYDNDHINGFLNLAKDGMISSKTVKCFWMNYGIKMSKQLKNRNVLTFSINNSTCETSVGQGKELGQFLTDSGIGFKPCIISENVYSINKAVITILSPSKKQLINLLDEIKINNGCLIIDEEENNLCETAGTTSDFTNSIGELINKKFEEDDSVSNHSSIAFLFEFKSFKILMLGDSVPSQIVKSLKLMGYSKENKLKLDYCKISHHGSKQNTSNELIELIDCQNYIISSDWKSSRPNKESLSRIVAFSNKPVAFLCNYQPKEVFTKQEMDKYGISFLLLNNNEIVMEE